MEWNYDEDLVTVAFSRAETTVEEIERAIESLGYGVAAVQGKELSAQGDGAGLSFSVPADAPAFFRDAVARARADRRPLLVDFWAAWCAPCLKLKRETLESDLLAPILRDFEVVFVDLDDAPSLGMFYSVTSVPCVIVVDAEGTVSDRILGFAPPYEFAPHLRKALR